MYLKQSKEDRKIQAAEAAKRAKNKTAAKKGKKTEDDN